jgi:hypothetical protein
MANARVPGPQRHGECSTQIDDGTMCRQPSPAPGPVRGDFGPLSIAAQHFARFVSKVGEDAAIALLLHKAADETSGGKGPKPENAPPQLVSLTPEVRVALRPDISLPGAGRSGENVKFLTGPANSAVKSVAPGRVFVTNSVGQVVLDITLERVKQVRPQVGFVGEKRQSLTKEELNLIKQLWNR